jgi:hypothetical protein
MPQRVVQRLTARVPEDPVEFWLRRLDSDTRAVHRSHFERWMNWLHKQPGWADVTSRELLIRQLEGDDSYVVVDLCSRTSAAWSCGRAQSRKRIL